MLFDVSHLLQIGLIAPKLNIDHSTGIYEINEFRFTDPFIGYGFSLLEFDRTFVTIGDAEEVFVDRIMGYESSNICECACIDAGFLLQFPFGAAISIFAFQCGATSGGFKVSAVVGFPGVSLHQQIIAVGMPHQNLTNQVM